ncbi:hypothetical protein DMENIID0001_093970 [Sergentomyia squamirostris]
MISVIRRAHKGIRKSHYRPPIRPEVPAHPAHPHFGHFGLPFGGHKFGCSSIFKGMKQMHRKPGVRYTGYGMIPGSFMFYFSPWWEKSQPIMTWITDFISGCV